MARTDCERERDVLDTALAGRLGMDDDLRQHLESCRVCADLAAVAGAFESSEGDEAGARIPSSAAMWLRAQTRARREAVLEASGPVTAAQVVAMLLAVLAIGVAAAAAWVTGAAPLAGLLSMIPAVELPRPALELADTVGAVSWYWIGLAAVAWLVVPTVAVYLAGD